MARKRMIDPSIWTDDGMAELTPRQQLLYIGLFSNADDDGRLKGSPVAISLMLPALYRGIPDAEINSDLEEVCGTMRQLTRYTVEGRPYLVFQNFRQWQRIDKPSPSILPEPPAESEPTEPPKQPFDERSANDPGTVPPNRSKEKGTEAKGTEDKSRANNRAAVEDDPRVDESSGPEPSTDQPFDLLESLCTTLGQDVTTLGKSERGKQLAVAKRLIADGVSANDVERMTKWLRSQRWVTGGIDLFFLEKQMGKWILEGKPDEVKPGALTIHEGGRSVSRSTNASGQKNLTDDELDDIIFGRTA